MTRVLVTCAAYPTGRNAVRSLVEQEGIEVFASCSRAQALSRLPFDVPKVPLPAPEDPAFAETLKQFCLQNGIEVVLPGLDAMSIVLSRHKAFFAASGISIPVPDYPVLIRGVDKHNLMECVKAAGLPYTRSVLLRSDDDIEQIASLTYPVIAKPAFGHGARGVQIYERPPSDWSPLKKALKKGGVLVQEYIPGGPGSIHACCFVFDQKQEVKLMFQQKSTRTEFEFGGAALAAVSIREPRLQTYTERLMREIGPWVGIVMVEFKRHEATGELYAMDCNARIWGISSVADDAGLSFPLAAVYVAKDMNFRTHEDYLTDMHTEREGLVDRSTYRFSCGTPVNRFPRSVGHVNGGRRTITLVPDERDQHGISAALADSDVDAVVVLESENRIRREKHEKLHFWSAPINFRREELPYWMAHLFRATEVRVMDQGAFRTHSWTDLRRAWWFGGEKTAAPLLAEGGH
jgi:predicted ATP-grasp superfamily ATP-dependent carboligase